MDKQTLEIDDNLEFVLYRVFWDNIFWDEVQFAHVGQDDNRGSSKDVAGLRRKYNRFVIRPVSRPSKQTNLPM